MGYCTTKAATEGRGRIREGRVRITTPQRTISVDRPTTKENTTPSNLTRTCISRKPVVMTFPCVKIASLYLSNERVLKVLRYVSFTSSVILESANFHELSENGIYPSFFTDSDIVPFAIPRTFTVPSDNVLYCTPPTVTVASCIGEPDTSTTVIVTIALVYSNQSNPAR